MTIEQQARVEQACEIMHDAYELAAKGAGWETNPASRKAWKDVPEANKVTMRAAVSALLGHLSSQAPGNLSEEEIERVVNEMMEGEVFQGSPVPILAHADGIKRALRYARDHYLSGWVAVKDKEPSEDQEVLAWLTGRVWMMRLVDDCWYYDGDIWDGDPPTHWMPLPIPPYTPQQEQR